MAGQLFVLEFRDAVGRAFGKPHRTVAGHVKPAQACNRRVERECSLFSIRRNAHDGLAKRVGEPDRTLRIYIYANRFDIVAFAGEYTRDFPLAQMSERIGRIHGEPDAAIRCDGQRGGNIGRFLHGVFDKIAIGSRTPWREQQDQCDGQAGGDQHEKFLFAVHRHLLLVEIIDARAQGGVPTQWQPLRATREMPRHPPSSPGPGAPADWRRLHARATPYKA